MAVYLVWNIPQQKWRMNGLVGFTEEVEFAGIFSENFLEKHTGMLCNKTGDYANNILVVSRSLLIKDFEIKVNNLSSSEKKALKRAINVERKRRLLPVEVVVKGGIKYCPYCKKPIKTIYNRITDTRYCKCCGRPVLLKVEEW